MNNYSIWKDDVKYYRNKNKIVNDMDVDIVIIGAGLAGLSTGINLIDKKKKIIIIEKGKIGNGITSNSTGKLTFMQGLVYSKITKLTNYNTAYKYYLSQKEAIKLAKETIDKYHISCNYEEVSSITFTNDSKKVSEFKKEESFYQRAGISYTVLNKLPNNYPCLYGLKVNKTAVFNPIKYLFGLRKEIIKTIPIYENTSALNLKKIYNKYKIETSHGSVWARKVIVCTHYPFFVTPGLIPFKTYIEKSYVLASKVDKTHKFCAITSNKPIISMRYYKKNYLLFATNSHRTTSKDNYRENFNELISKYNSFTDKPIDYIWSTHDIMTTDYMPYIGELSPNLFIATGFNKWGMTNSILAGKILSDLVLNNKNNYRNLFAPSRKNNRRKMINLITNNFNTSKTFIGMKLDKNKKYYSSAYVIKEDGKNIGVYDDGNKKYKVLNTCPHMGCSLMFNEFDKTWDCPCHGSRFDIDGKCINGPSVYSIKYDSTK